MEETLTVWWCEEKRITGFDKHCEQCKDIGFVTFIRTAENGEG